MIPKMPIRIAKIIDANPVLLALSVLLLAIALFAVLFGILWAIQSLTGAFDEVRQLAGEIGVDTRSLLEFIGLFAGVTILVGQFWLTHRRIGAAESTDTAAQETAASTVLSHSAQQFREAVESLSSPSDCQTRRATGFGYHGQELSRVSGCGSQHHSRVRAAAERRCRHQHRGVSIMAKVPRDRAFAMSILFTGHGPTTFAGKQHDLHGAKLPELMLENAEMPGVVLTGADLRKVSLVEANLREAKLGEAILDGAILRKAKLCRASLF